MKILLPFLLLYRRHWLRMALGILLAITTLLASIGLLALSGWFLAASAVVGPAGLYSFNYLLPAAGVRGAAIFRTAGRYAERLVSHDATFRVLAHLRVFTFSRLLPLSPSGMARFQKADLLNRLVADVDTLDHLYLRVISPLISALVVIGLVTTGLCYLDVASGLTFGVIMLTLLLLLPLLFYRAGQPIGQELTLLRNQYRIQLTCWLQGQAELVIFDAEKTARRQLERIEQRWLDRQQQQARLSGLSQSVIIAAAGLTLCLLLWLAVGDLPGSGALLALFVFTPLAAFETLGPVAGAFQHMGQVMASARRISQIIKQQPEVVFPVKSNLPIADVSLKVQQLSFTYPQQPLPTIKAVNLHIRSKEHVALLGKTGCGKSTLLQLLTRAWDPQQGTILLNEQPLDQYSEATLRSAMSVLSQRVHVFNSRLRDNLLLASPHSNDQRLEQVLHQVGLERLLENEGLNAWLGEGGRQLSGGEQRRLGLARALLHNAPLWLLDEPTEGLDASTERQILSLLSQHCQNKTLLMITHRPAAVEKMDRVLIMDEGRIKSASN